MSRYRKVRSRLWLEPEFAALSDVEKLVALYLTTGPQTAPPGVFRLSCASAAEDLRCSTQAFERRLATVVRGLGWKYDAIVRVLWQPEWVLDNPPANPNGVVAWRSCFDEIPDCALKRESWTAVRTFLAPRGESFVKPFREPMFEPSAERFAEPLPEPPTNGSPNTPSPSPEIGMSARFGHPRRVDDVGQKRRMVDRLHEVRKRKAAGAQPNGAQAAMTSTALPKEPRA